MISLIIGYPDSGKSMLAEDRAVELAENGRKYYIAAMIPYGEEGRHRVIKHRKMREGKGFVTLEVPFDVSRAAEQIEDISSATLILECVSNLAANEIFERHTPAGQAVNKISEDIAGLGSEAGNLVIVSNHFKDEGYDGETAEYIRSLDLINERLRAVCDELIELKK